MTVHFIGAGPGAPDLITLRGQRLISACPVCLYAGSLVPATLLDHCPPNARIINTAPMSLDAIMDEISAAHAAGHDIARLHSGDVSIWSAMGEHLPALAQSVVLTRTSGRASAMPPRENLAAFAATGATLAIHLSIHTLDTVLADLIPHYGPDCPVAVVWRASWPDQRIIRATLGTLSQDLGAELERTALILVGRALGEAGFEESSLYAADYDRRYRPIGTDPRFPDKAS